MVARRQRMASLALLVSLFAAILLSRPPTASGFAAAKKGGGSAKNPAKRNKSKTAPAKTKRGFGAPPPTADEILDAIPTRLPTDALTRPCPCGGRTPGLTYDECCRPYHDGSRLPDSPMAVLRSRYTAFCWRLPRYIMQTTHESSPEYIKNDVVWAKDLEKDGMFDSYEFVSLTPGEEELDGDRGALEFEVRLRAKRDIGATREGQVEIIRERSTFVQYGDPPRWGYVGGEVVKDRLRGDDDS